ncbi:MAG: dephospho-CoA kinase [Kiritimatiellae bacterium]|nr:dephospho-CoA kinase [Kiritimatiellia bacterium]
MLRIAITGGIACGKTLVGSFLEEYGVPVCESDELGHALMDRDGKVFDNVLAEFGTAILRGDGSIDRRKLGRMVFEDRTRLTRLNAITHPEIEKVWQKWLTQQEREVTAAAVIIPLLHEGGYAVGWDHIVCVSAYEAAQIQRLKERRLDESDAMVRIRAQIDVAEKVERSEFVVFNNGSKEIAREQVKRIMVNILEK